MYLSYFQNGGQDGAQNTEYAISWVIYKLYSSVWHQNLSFLCADSLVMIYNYVPGIHSKWRTRWRQKHRGCLIMGYIQAILLCLVSKFKFLLCKFITYDMQLC